METTPNLENIALTDWARLAAYLDGEGCILITYVKHSKRPRGYHQLVVRITNSDPRLLRWLNETFGGSINMTPQNNKFCTRPCYYWGITAASAEDILRRCQPFVIMKKEQIELALAFRDTFVDGWNTRRTPQETVVQREQFKKELSALKRVVQN